jgi:hypothetical protein
MKMLRWKLLNSKLCLLIERSFKNNPSSQKFKTELLRPLLSDLPLLREHQG